MTLTYKQLAQEYLKNITLDGYSTKSLDAYKYLTTGLGDRPNIDVDMDMEISLIHDKLRLELSTYYPYDTSSILTYLASENIHVPIDQRKYIYRGNMSLYTRSKKIKLLSSLWIGGRAVKHLEKYYTLDNLKGLYRAYTWKWSLDKLYEHSYIINRIALSDGDDIKFNVKEFRNGDYVIEDTNKSYILSIKYRNFLDVLQEANIIYNGHYALMYSSLGN